MPGVIGPAAPDSPSAAYCDFKSDRHRLYALISRDIRLVLIRLLLVVAAASLGGGWF